MQGETRSISFDGREIRLTTRRYAPQAGGSVLIECGDTAVLVTATRANAREGIDFLPLTCDYEERLYAAGRIPGSFMRRESRPPERATLACRLIAPDPSAVPQLDARRSANRGDRDVG